MNGQRYTPSQLGLVYGMALGAALGLLLLSFTGDAIWLVLTGVGITLGYGIGATWERRVP